MKTAGLDAAQLDQRLEPSTMTLGGMLKHLAYVEDWWVNQVFADNPAPEPWASVDWKADSDWEWHSRRRGHARTAEGAVRRDDRHLRPDPARGARASQRLESLVVVPSGAIPSRRYNLRWILVHLLEEYARHNGHADLIRESIDGSVGE